MSSQGAVSYNDMQKFRRNSTLNRSIKPTSFAGTLSAVASTSPNKRREPSKETPMRRPSTISKEKQRPGTATVANVSLISTMSRQVRVQRMMTTIKPSKVRLL